MSSIIEMRKTKSGQPVNNNQSVGGNSAQKSYTGGTASILQMREMTVSSKRKEPQNQAAVTPLSDAEAKPANAEPTMKPNENAETQEAGTSNKEGPEEQTLVQKALGIPEPIDNNISVPIGKNWTTEGQTFLRNSPMANAPKGMNSSKNNLLYDRKVVTYAPQVIEDKESAIAQNEQNIEAAAKGIDAAQRKADDVVFLYNGKRQEDGTIVFPTQDGVNAYNAALAEEDKHRSTMYENISAVMTNDAELGSAITQWQDAEKRVFEKYATLDSEQLSFLAENGDQAAIEYQYREGERQADYAQTYIRDGGTFQTAVNDYQEAKKRFDGTSSKFYGAVTALDDYVDAFLQAIPNDERADALRAARDKDRAAGVDLGNGAIYTDYQNFFKTAVDVDWMEEGFVPEELANVQNLAPVFREEKAKLEAAGYDMSALLSYVMREALKDPEFSEKSKLSREVAASLDGEVGDVYKQLYNYDLMSRGIENGAFSFVSDFDGVDEVNGVEIGDSLACMTTAEIELFLYLCNNGETDKAALFMVSIAESLKLREVEGEANSVDYPVIRELYALDMGLIRGAEALWRGAKTIFVSEDAPALTTEDYVLGTLQQRHKGTFAGYAIAAANNIGNMAPSIVGYAINPVVGTTATFLNARGNAYAEAKRNGYSDGQAWVYSTLVGASEAGLEKVLGGMGGLAKGMVPTKIMSIMPKVSSTIGKLATKFTTNLFSEVLEENLQNYLEPAFQMMVGAEKAYDAPDLDEFLETTIVTAITTTVFAAASGRKTYNQIEFDDQAGQWAQALMKADENSVYYKEGVKLAGLLEYGGHATVEYITKMYERMGFKLQKTGAVLAQQETQARAESVQKANPEASVIRSAGTQAYLDTGAVTLNVAKEAGAVLDKIVSGELTAENISNSELDKLKLQLPFGIAAVSNTLGVDVSPRRSGGEVRNGHVISAADARRAGRSAIRQYTENVKVEKTQQSTSASAVGEMQQSTVATAQTGAQRTQSVHPETSAGQTGASVQTQQMPTETMQQPTQQPVSEQPAVQSGAPTAAQQAEPEQTASAVQRPSFSGGSIEGAIDAAEFTRQYKEIDSGFSPTKGAEAYGNYLDNIGSGREMLTPFEFARQYREKYPRASKRQVAKAYGDYAKSKHLDDSAFTDSTRNSEENLVKQSVKETEYGVEHNEYSAQMDSKIVNAVDALAKLFGIKVRFADLGNDNGLYHSDTGLVELDINPVHNRASNPFLFTISHEIGHAIKSRIGESAWSAFARYAVKVMGGETAVDAKRKSDAAYENALDAREDVVCDFIGELLSDKQMLDTFCESIKTGEVETKTAHGIIGVINQLLSKIRKKGSQSNAETDALIQRVQEQFGADIETAEKAVKQMQRAVQLALEAEKNTAEGGSVTMYAKKAKDATRKLNESGNADSIKEQIRAASTKLDEMDPVVSIVDPFDTGVGIDTAVKWILSKISMTSIDRRGYGVVAFDEHWIRNGLKYVARDSNEIAAMIAVPYVIKRGIVIAHDSNHKGRNFSTTTFGAPVELNGKRGNMGVVVKETSPYHYDVHRILTPDGFAFEIPEYKNAEPTTEEALSQNETGIVAPISSALDNSIRDSSLKSNPSETKKSVKDSLRRAIPNAQEAAEIEAQAKARQEEAETERVRYREDFMRKFVAQSPAHQKHSRKDTIDKMVDKHGRIPQGENPVRDVAVPKSTDGSTKVRQTVRTAMEAEVTPDSMLPTIEDSIIAGAFNYEAETNKKQVEKARAWAEEREIEDAVYDWSKDVAAGKTSTEIVARGMVLYNAYATAAANAANVAERTKLLKTATRLLADISSIVTKGAQITQMVRILKKLSPDMQLYALERNIQKLQDKLNETYSQMRGNKAAPTLTLDKNLAQQWLGALRRGDAVAAEMFEKVLYAQIATQVPKTYMDRWNAWRYLCMLGNPKTIIRNTFGNIGFMPAKAMKDKIGALAERIGRVSKAERTKYGGMLFASERGRNMLKAAQEDFQSPNVQEMLNEGFGKYSDTTAAGKLGRAIADMRRTFRLSDGAKAKTKAGKYLRTAASAIPYGWQRATNWAMNEAPVISDMAFMKHHYEAAFAQAAMARGYTAEMIQNGTLTENQIDGLRAYAVRQALKATYRDCNAVSQFLTKLRYKGNNKVGKAANIVMEGTLPFRATPANVLVRSFEYSPLGLLKAISTDLYAVHHGDISATEYVERLSSGMTGTAIWGLGWLLTALGVVRVHADDDDDEREGRQSYSLEIGDKSITLDWLAPASIPFFMGAEMQEIIGNDDGATFLTAFGDSMSRAFAPMLEMSMLSGVQDMLDTMTYSFGDGADLSQILTAFFVQPFMSYIGQGIPTVLGQFASALEPNRTTTYVGNYSGQMERNFIRMLARITEKFPGVDLWQMDYVDEWGRKDSNGNFAERFFNNFLNPAYVSTINVTDADAEIRRLEESTGAEISPTRRGYTITVSKYDDEGNKLSSDKVRLTAEQYERYATEYGTQAALMLTALMHSDYYDELSDEEKVKAFSDIDHLADEYGKVAAGVGYRITPTDSERKLYELTSAGIPVAEAYAVKLCHTQFDNDENLKPTERYERFMAWVYGNDAWTDEEKDLIASVYGKFSSGFTVSSEKFDAMAASSIGAVKSQSISAEIGALIPEGDNKTVSPAQKWEAIIARDDLTPQEQDVAIRTYMSDEEEKRYDACARAGVTAVEYVTVNSRIRKLQPIGDAKGVSSGQKWQVCISSTSSTQKQDALLRCYMSEEQEMKYNTCRDANISPSTYVTYYNAKNTYGDGNGAWTQAELKDWLNSQNLTQAQKSILWSITNSSWKNNPFD